MNPMTKPTFLVGKGESKSAIDTSTINEHYRRVFRGLIAWDGLPSEAPHNFPQDCIFYTGGCGCKKMRGFGAVMAGVRPTTLTVYGIPYDWIPQPIGMAMDLTNEFFTPSHDPCLYIGDSIQNLISPYITIMDKTIKTLNINVVGLRQPIAVQGVPGGEMDAIVMKSSIDDGDTYIPTTGGTFRPEILDLKATDHTQNLISTLDWCDARILEVMMSSNGVEKASGITTLETVSGVQSIMQEYDDLIERCREFCDKVNDRFKLSMSVRPGKGIESLMQGPQPAPQQGGDENAE